MGRLRLIKSLHHPPPLAVLLPETLLLAVLALAVHLGGVQGRQDQDGHQE
jgi:hypothetical protein